jgi:hypothetical protein
MRLLRLLLALGITALLGGCSLLQGTLDLPSDPNAAVVRIEYQGGMIAPQGAFQQLPLVAIYADGRVLQPGPVPAIYPGPLLQHLQEQRIGRVSIARLLAAARVAGLTTADVSYPAQTVADAPDTVITIRTGQRTVVSRFGALGIEMGARGTAAERAARTAASTFVAQATDLRSLLGAEAVREVGAYAPAALRVMDLPGTPQPSDPALARPAVPWPLATPLASFGSHLEHYPVNYRCGVVSGADLATLMPVLEQATTLTGFTSGGETYLVVPRPLLPDESGC